MTHERQADRDQGYDWTRFSVATYCQADLSMVWRAWSTGSGLESFLLEECRTRLADGRVIAGSDTFEAGARYRWRWRHGHTLDGEILAVEPPGLVRFTFGGMTVEVQLTDGPGGVLMMLQQSDISGDEQGRIWGHLNCRSCWVFFMTNLASVLATGTDLRHTDASRASAMEVGYVPEELALRAVRS